MARYTTKGCPYCGFKYEILEPDSSVRFGSPLRKCVKCQKSFVDKDYKELAIEKPDPLYEMKVQPYGVLLVMVGIALAIFFLVKFGFELSDFLSFYLVPLFFVCFGVILIIMNLRSYDKRVEDVKTERAASEARLKNPEYAKALAELGYSVPEKYLYPNKSEE